MSTEEKWVVEVPFEEQTGLSLHVSIASAVTPSGEPIEVSLAGMLLLVKVGNRYYKASLEPLVVGIVEMDPLARPPESKGGEDG